MEIVSPSGRVYQWSKPTPPTAEDIAALQQFDAQQAPAPRAQPRQPNSGIPQFDPAMAMDGVPVRMQPPTAQDMAALQAGINGVAGAGADIGMEAGGATLGQMAGAATGPFSPVMVPLLGGAGGAVGNAAGQLRRGDPFSLGQVGGAFVTGMVPGASMAKAGVKTVGKEMLKQGIGNVAAKAAEIGIDERGRMITPAEMVVPLGGGIAGVIASKGLDEGMRVAKIATAKLRNTIRDENVIPGILAGYVLSPTALDKRAPGTLNSVLESIGGKAATNAEASLINQDVTNNLARRNLGLPALTPLRRSEPAEGIIGTAEQVRKQWAKPYQELSGMSEKAKADLHVLDTKTRLTAQNDHELNILMSDPKMVKDRAELMVKAGADVEALKVARFEGYSKMKAAFENKGDPELLKEARSWMAKADDLENKIEIAARQVGRPGLLDELREARKRISQSYVVENALGHDGHVSAPVLGRMLDAGIPLTDELRTIAKFEQTFGRIMQEASKAISPTTSYAKAVSGAVMATPGAVMHNAPLAALGAALPWMAPTAARRTMFSQPYQNMFMRPNYGEALADPLAQFARMSTEAASRQPNSFLRFLEEKYPRQQDQGRPIPFR